MNIQVNSQNNTNNRTVSDPLWMNDLTILLNKDRFTHLLPNMKMTYTEKTNAVVRLGIVVGLLLWLYNDNYLYLYVPIIIMALSAILYMFRRATPELVGMNNNLNGEFEDEEVDFDQIVDDFEDINNNKRCVKPSPENPFMNVMPGDNRRRRLTNACNSYDNSEIQEEINTHFDSRLYKDVSDIFNNRNSQREFYTMPSTTIPNDQETFSKWLYLTPPSCKDGNGNQCVANNMERLNGQSYLFESR